MNEVYEVIAQGAVEGGYVYAEQSVGICSTLERAIEMAKSEPVDGHMPLDCINRYSVFVRHLDTPFIGIDDAPVFTHEPDGYIDPLYYEYERPCFAKSEVLGVCVRFDNDYDRSEYLYDQLTSKTFESSDDEEVIQYMKGNDLVWDAPTTLDEGCLKGMTVTYSVRKEV